MDNELWCDWEWEESELAYYCKLYIRATGKAITNLFRAVIGLAPE